jgi:flagella basal body P-ring formation protein FlgA
MRAFSLGIVVLLVVAAEAGEPLTIALRAETTVDAARVTLDDVAAVTGGSRDLAERVASIDLGPAPGPGAEREMTRQFLALRLRQARLDPRSIAWAGAERTRVARRSTRLAGATIAQAAVDHVRKVLPWPDEDLVVEVQREPADLHLPGSSHDVELEAAVPPGTRLLGAVPCSVTLTRARRVVGRTSVVLQVRVFQRLLIARRRTRMGERLTKDHVRLQRSELTSLTTDAITDLALALGQEARHDIQPFAVLTHGMLRAPRVVRRGALVTLAAETPRLRVTARGIAQRDGAVGEWIAVRNVDSQKVIYGRVRDAETVEVRF